MRRSKEVDSEDTEESDDSGDTGEIGDVVSEIGIYFYWARAHASSMVQHYTPNIVFDGKTKMKFEVKSNEMKLRLKMRIFP